MGCGVGNLCENNDGNDIYNDNSQKDVVHSVYILAYHANYCQVGKIASVSMFRGHGIGESWGCGVTIPGSWDCG